MSVKVDLDKLTEALRDYSFGYLITVGDDFRAHTVAVDPGYAEGAFDVGAVGKHTRANVTAHPDVTIIWPPADPGGYTLIVDGTGLLTDDGLRVTPTRAVLHRSARSDSTATSPDGLHDCVPLRVRSPARSAKSRVAPLAPPWSEADADGINSWGHPDRTYEPLLLVRCLQRHPLLAAKLRKLGEALYVDTKLPPRVRTIAILRICALVGCAYEWGGQAAFWGPLARVSDAECDALVTGAEVGWTDAERALIDAVDELEATGTWATATWDALGRNLDDEQRMELLIAVGWYRTICTLCNGLALPVEGWMRAWPLAS